MAGGTRHQSRARGDPGGDRRGHVHVGRRRAGLCLRRGQRQGTVAVRAGGGHAGQPHSVLRHGQSRGRGGTRQSLRQRARRDALCARRQNRAGRVEGRCGRGSQARDPFDRCPRSRRRCGGDRQRRGRVRRARLCQRVRSRQRQARLAVPRGSPRPQAGAAGSPGSRACGEDLGSCQPLGPGRRRCAVGCDQLRSGNRPGAGRNRQRRTVSHRAAVAEGRRQPLSVVDRRAGREKRTAQVVLSGNAGRQLGLHRDPADDPDRHDHRRRKASGGAARTQERLPLRARSPQWKAAARQPDRAHQLGVGNRSGDRTTEPDPGIVGLRERAENHLPRDAGGAQLAPRVL